MLARYFCDLKAGDKVYVVSGQTLEISEIAYINIDSNRDLKYANLDLYPIIGNWKFVWLTKREYESDMFWFGGTFYTVSEQEAIRILKHNIENETV